MQIILLAQFKPEELLIYNALIQKLQFLNTSVNLQLSEAQIDQICVDILILFHDIKQATLDKPYLSHAVDDRIVWTVDYQTTIEYFKQRFLSITAPLGKIAPSNNDNTLWVGSEGMIAAAFFGSPTMNTNPVRLIDAVIFKEIKDAYYPNFNFANPIQDAAMLCVYWSIISSIYAENIQAGNIKLYMATNIIHVVSFFWNFELPIIRKNCPDAQFFIIHLADKAQATLAQLKTAGEQIDFETQEGPICALLKDPNNWITSVLEEHLELSTNPNKNKQTLSYKKLKYLFNFWKEKTEKPQNALQPPMENTTQQRM